MNETFVLRPAQERILEYEGEQMGISAVPGSGKTFTLSLLAARLVARLAAAEGGLENREVLVVTFTNSAVENFRSSISGFLRGERGLLPNVGYRVRTLHGLAHDIVRERPGLVGLSESFDIVDERTANEIKRDVALGYLRSQPDALSSYIQPDYLQNPRRIERALTDDAVEIANAFIRIAKDLQAPPHELAAARRKQSGTWPLLDFGLHVYAEYQRNLQLRGAVDFDDLILLALQALSADEGYLHRLQERWPYVLEDEAQDSSLLQERMLRLLTRGRGNWVRVGDPNQAINTTFTSADTSFLRKFMAQYPFGARDLPNSGRSALPIIELANYLIDWSRTEHPVLSEADALAPPPIQPTPPGDPQPNPEPGEQPLYFFERALTPQQEVEAVITSLRRWLPQHPGWTVAVLAPENHAGFRLAEALKAANLPYDDSLLRSDSATRAAAQALSTVLTFIAQPQSAAALAAVWRDVWWARRGRARQAAEAGLGEEALPALPPDPAEAVPAQVLAFGRELERMREPEAFIFPGARDSLEALAATEELEPLAELIGEFRRDLRRWAEAQVLPIDELLLTVGNDLFSEPASLALTYHLAVLLAKLGRENPTWRLPELAGELDNIAQNKRRILGFSEEGLGYKPKPGQVTVATMHAAKGLEWDRVYLTAVNNYGFPSGAAGDAYRSERWYVRDRLNLTAETEAQVRQLRMGTLDEYVAGRATEEARVALAAERLRLLYVGITRARRELIVTYNVGRNAERDPRAPALAFQALADHLNGQ